jgi:ABC-type amino acid transport substrate-binding protein
VRRWWWAAALLLVVAVGIVLVGREAGLPLLAPRDRTWQAIQSRGVWRVGLDPSFPPFEHLDEAGRPVGFDVELAQRIAATWGGDVELISIGFDSLLDAVRTARVDSVVSAYPYDPRLTRDVRFSTPYFDAGIRLAVRADSALQAVEGLTQGTVAVEWGSMGDLVGRRLQREQPALELAQFQTPAEVIDALVTNPAISAALTDNVTLRQAQAQGQPIRGIDPILESNPYVIVMPFAARTVAEHVDQALADLQASGQLAELESQWFATEP